jgi:hypothetical protein
MPNIKERLARLARESQVIAIISHHKPVFDQVIPAS